jgi:hypothetical protein
MDEAREHFLARADSPTISTVQSVPATRRARSTIRREDASTATGSSVSLKLDSMLIGNLNSLANAAMRCSCNCRACRFA